MELEQRAGSFALTAGMETGTSWDEFFFWKPGREGGNRHYY